MHLQHTFIILSNYLGRKAGVKTTILVMPTFYEIQPETKFPEKHNWQVEEDCCLATYRKFRGGCKKYWDCGFVIKFWGLRVWKFFAVVWWKGLA